MIGVFGVAVLIDWWCSARGYSQMRLAMWSVLCVSADASALLCIVCAAGMLIVRAIGVDALPACVGAGALLGVTALIWLCALVLCGALLGVVLHRPLIHRVAIICTQLLYVPSYVASLRFTQSAHTPRVSFHMCAMIAVGCTVWFA
jgi:hypothetical protein